jgi:hypothetical protein
VTTLNSIKEKTELALANSGAKALDFVVNQIVARKEKEYAEACAKVVASLEEATKEKYKLAKPDAITYNADGTVAASAFTKARLDEQKKLNEKIEKIENALKKAFEADDFEKVLELGK